MNLNKCERCGCFFVTQNAVCPNCQSKDENEISQLKNYLAENDTEITVEELSYNTGISLKNVNRFLDNEDVKNQFIDLGLNDNDIKINL